MKKRKNLLSERKKMFGDLFLVSSFIFVCSCHLNHSETIDNKKDYLSILDRCLNCIQFYSREINQEDVTSIYFGGVEPTDETTHTIVNPGEIMSWKDYRDTTVYDGLLIRRYISLTNQLVPKRDSGYVDIRAFSIIRMKNRRRKITCYGYPFGTIQNGSIMEDNQELFFFIDSLIYAN